MQNRFKVQYQAFLSKIEILITYWDKTIGKIMNFSIKSKDPKVALLVRQLISIPKDIRFCALKHVVRKSLELHAIAFF